MKTKSSGKTTKLEFLLILLFGFGLFVFFGHTTGFFEVSGLVKTEEKESTFSTKPGKVQGFWIAVEFPKN